MYPLFASFIIFIIFFSWSMRRHKNDDPMQNRSFFEKEQEANHTRRKDIEHLDYIQIPEKFLSVLTTSRISDSFIKETMSESDYSELHEDHTRLMDLSQKRVLNLTGYSNTELKLQYGVANLAALSEYDQNYTLLVRTLQKLAKKYFDLGYPELSEELLEFALQTNTDITNSYLLLAEIYVQKGKSEQVDSLLQHTFLLPESRKKIIDRKLQEFCQSHDLLHS